VKRNESVNL